MMLSAACALMMLALRRDAAWSVATAKVAGSGSAVLARDGDGDVATAGWFVHAWPPKPDI
jgi:hypothetical protein